MGRGLSLKANARPYPLIPLPTEPRPPACQNTHPLPRRNQYQSKATRPHNIPASHWHAPDATLYRVEVLLVLVSHGSLLLGDLSGVAEVVVPDGPRDGDSRWLAVFASVRWWIIPRQDQPVGCALKLQTAAT